MTTSLEKSGSTLPAAASEKKILEYDAMIEELRTRLNVLSTSLFLLHESSNSDDPKLKRYLKKINLEMEKIRQIISHYPKNSK